MIAASFFDADGRITQTATLLNADEADATVAARGDLSGWVSGVFNGASHYVSEGEAVPRPATGLPAAHALAADTDWTVPDVPEGTAVRIDGEDMGTTDAEGLTLTFAAAGVWRVDLGPPFPWLPASCEVTVT
jgi:hypothetical protein